MKILHIYQIKANMIHRNEHVLSKHPIVLLGFYFDIFSMQTFKCDIINISKI